MSDDTLELEQIEKWKEAGTSSSLAQKYRARSESRTRDSKKKVDISLAAVMRRGMNIVEEKDYFGGEEEMLDFIAQTENDEKILNDPFKKQMKFMAIKALVGDLLEESNVYSVNRVNEADED